MGIRANLQPTAERLAPVLLSCLIGLGCIIGPPDTSLALSVTAHTITSGIDQNSDPTMGFFIGDSEDLSDQVGPVTATSTTIVGDVLATGTATSDYGAARGVVSVSYVGSTAEGRRVAATSQSQAYWGDEFSVFSTSLAAGTPVTLEGLLTLDGITFADGGFVGGTVEATFQSIRADDSYTALTYTYGAGSVAGGFQLSTPITFNTFVGDTFSANSALVLSAYVDTIYLPASGLQRIGPSALTFDVSHTSLFTLTSATPGANFTAASGASYLPPVSSVPEPSTLLLLGVALPILLLLQRKQLLRINSQA